MILLCSYFNKKLFKNSDEKLSLQRNQEYNISLIKNLNCPYFEQIHLLIENEYSLNILNELIKNNKNKDKIVKVMFNKQPIFKDFFYYANKNLNNKVVMLSNNDIYLYKCQEDLIDYFIDKNNYVFCLTRHENKRKKPLIDKHIQSFDSYLFKSPVPDAMANELQFKQNLRGSDNLMVYFFQKYGYNTLNPCHQIKIFHMHKSKFREVRYKKINNNSYVKDYVGKRAEQCRLNSETGEIIII